MEEETRYYVCKDLEGGNFAMGRDFTIEQWRGLALEWAFSDDHYGIMFELSKLPKEQVLDYIAEFWAIQFKACRKDKKHFREGDAVFWDYEHYAKKYCLCENTWFNKKQLEYNGKQYTPKQAIDSVLNFLYIIEDNTNYEIKEVTKAINNLQKIEFVGGED